MKHLALLAVLGVSLSGCFVPVYSDGSGAPPPNSNTTGADDAVDKPPVQR